METPTHINGATLDVHYPSPTGSDTFVASSSMHRLERPIHLGACAPLSSSPWTLQSIADRLSRVSAASRRAFACRLAKEPTFHGPPRRGPRSIEPKVSSILEEHL